MYFLRFHRFVFSFIFEVFVLFNRASGRLPTSETWSQTPHSANFETGLRTIRTHSSDHLAGLGVLIGEFCISEHEESRFSVVDQIFFDGPHGSLALHFPACLGE